MLPKQHRLSLRKELRRIQKKGHLIHGRYFSLLIAPRLSKGKDNSIPNYSRLAFIISKKIHQKAVKRNQIRRRLIEATRSYLPELNLGFEIVFLVKKAIVNTSFEEVSREVGILFKKAKVI
ncbi:ribonuclease P protein component [Patescibacteria group bacterium]